MKIKLPKRFYTVEQLAERWECKIEDVKCLIETGMLTSVWRLSALVGKDEEHIHLVPISCASAEIVADTVSKYYMEQQKWYEDNLIGLADDFMRDVHVEFYCTEVNPVTDLNGLEELKKNGMFDPVITAEEVSRYEQEHGEPDDDLAPVRATTKDTLTTRQRNNYLKVIGALLKDGYGMDIHASKLTGVTEILKDLEQQGADIGEQTLRRYIKEAAELLPPLQSRKP